MFTAHSSGVTSTRAPVSSQTLYYTVQTLLLNNAYFIVQITSHPPRPARQRRARPSPLIQNSCQTPVAIIHSRADIAPMLDILHQYTICTRLPRTSGACHTGIDSELSAPTGNISTCKVTHSTHPFSTHSSCLLSPDLLDCPLSFILSLYPRGRGTVNSLVRSALHLRAQPRHTWI